MQGGGDPNFACFQKPPKMKNPKGTPFDFFKNEPFFKNTGQKR